MSETKMPSKIYVGHSSPGQRIPIFENDADFKIGYLFNGADFLRPDEAGETDELDTVIRMIAEKMVNGFNAYDDLLKISREYLRLIQDSGMDRTMPEQVSIVRAAIAKAEGGAA